MKIHKIESTQVNNSIIQPVKRLTRVAAYCRVSTEADEQANSYEAQISHYTEEIDKHPDWINAGIFADKGISGTTAKKRPEFLKMIKKCKQKKIDLILVKSISRFSRNTVDCLEYIRELKDLGIGVIFEKENINTLTETSEAMITMMGYFAQAESESLSKNITWGIRHAYAEGKTAFSSDIYGYKRVFNLETKKYDTLEIKEEEAKIVREIFERYYAGDSQTAICASLNERNVPPPGKIDPEKSNKKWYPSSLQTILRNEKYKGDVLTQKTYCSNLLEHKRVKNTGQVAQHYLQDHHPAIVDRDLFDRVQVEYARRNAKKVNHGNPDEAPRKSRYNSKYALTDILVCGHCGSPYRRCVWTHHNKREVVWRCITRIEHGKDKCEGSFTIHEEDLHEAILQAISELSTKKNELKDELKAALATTILNDGTDMSIVAIEQQIKEQENDLMRVVRITSERGNKAEFETEFERISQNIKDLKRLLDVEKTKLKPKLDIESRLEDIFSKIDEASANIQEFNNQVIRQLVAQIRIDGVDKMTIILTNGYRFTAKL